MKSKKIKKSDHFPFRPITGHQDTIVSPLTPLLLGFAHSMETYSTVESAYSHKGSFALSSKPSSIFVKNGAFPHLLSL